MKTSDATGAVNLTRQYDAWGVLDVGTSQPGHAFTGREWEPELGLYYYRARYYDPQSGTFLAQDPLGIRPKDLNGYSYVSANPVAFVDPYGLTKTGWPKSPPTMCPKFPRRRPCRTGICGVVRDESPWTGKAVCFVIWYLKDCERTEEPIPCSQIPPEWDHECVEITDKPPWPTYTPPPPKCPPDKPCGPEF